MSRIEEPLAELTVVQAADLLNVSPAHLVDRISTGALLIHRTGSQVSLWLADVLAYRESIDADAGQALDDMSIEAENAGLYE